MRRRGAVATALSLAVAALGAVTVVSSTVVTGSQVAGLGGATVGRLAVFFAFIALGELARVTILSAGKPPPCPPRPPWVWRPR